MIQGDGRAVIGADGVCQHCDGAGCVACSARHLPWRARRELVHSWPTAPVEIDPVAAEVWLVKNEAETTRAWVPSIPLPLFIFPHRHRCDCGRAFWTLNGYRGHYALAHILHAEMGA